MSDIICSRKFGVTHIQINSAGHISIINTFNSNYGIIYSHQIKAFKAKLPGQIIGMDFQPCKTHIKYIYGRIQAGLFDHLIPTKEDNKQ